MKQLSVLATFLFLFFWSNVSASFIYTSTCGYQIKVDIIPTEIIPSNGNHCPWGYNYDLRFFYNVTVIGRIPSGECGSKEAGNLFTSQVGIYCNGKNSGGYNLPKNNGSGYAVTTTNEWIPYSGENTYRPPYVHCREANVANFNCNQIRIRLEGPGLNIDKIETIQPVLPLGGNLLSFESSTLEHNRIALGWSLTDSKEIASFHLYHQDKNGDLISEKTFSPQQSSIKGNDFQTIIDNLSSGKNYFTLIASGINGNMQNIGTHIHNHLFNTEVLIYPNPIKERVTIASADQDVKINAVTISNMLGQQIDALSMNQPLQEITLDFQYPGTQFIVEIQFTNGEVIHERLSR